MSCSRQHYLDPQIASQIAQVLVAGLAVGRYRPDEPALAEQVTADLQSINGDKHLRLIYHADPLAERERGDDTEEYASFARWADRDLSRDRPR